MWSREDYFPWEYNSDFKHFFDFLFSVEIWYLRISIMRLKKLLGNRVLLLWEKIFSWAQVTKVLAQIPPSNFFPLFSSYRMQNMLWKGKLIILETFGSDSQSDMWAHKGGGVGMRVAMRTTYWMEEPEVCMDNWDYHFCNRSESLLYQFLQPAQITDLSLCQVTGMSKMLKVLQSKLTHVHDHRTFYICINSRQLKDLKRLCICRYFSHGLYFHLPSSIFWRAEVLDFEVQFIIFFPMVCSFCDLRNLLQQRFPSRSFTVFVFALRSYSFEVTIYILFKIWYNSPPFLYICVFSCSNIICWKSLENE